MICRYRIYAKALMFAQLLTKLLWALSLIQKWKSKGYYETGIQFLHLDINSSLPRNDERLNTRECNPSLIRVGESKQEISNLDRELLKWYNLIRKIQNKHCGRNWYYIKKSLYENLWADPESIFPDICQTIIVVSLLLTLNIFTPCSITSISKFK